MARIEPGEIRALAKILDELDYYQVLEIPRDAPGSAVRAAYHQISRCFHPDANRTLDPELRDDVERIARRVTEAYSVLRDPRRRRVYDQRLARDGDKTPGLRVPLVEAQTQAGREAEAERGRTPNGRRYFALAEADRQRGDYASAERHLKLALTFEPDNALFRTRLHEVQSRSR